MPQRYKKNSTYASFLPHMCHFLKLAYIRRVFQCPRKSTAFSRHVQIFRHVFCTCGFLSVPLFDILLESNLLVFLTIGKDDLLLFGALVFAKHVGWLDLRNLLKMYKLYGHFFDKILVCREPVDTLQILRRKPFGGFVFFECHTAHEAAFKTIHR